MYCDDLDMHVCQVNMHFSLVAVHVIAEIKPTKCSVVRETQLIFLLLISCMFRPYLGHYRGPSSNYKDKCINI